MFLTDSKRHILDSSGREQSLTLEYSFSVEPTAKQHKLTIKNTMTTANRNHVWPQPLEPFAKAFEFRTVPDRAPACLPPHAVIISPLPNHQQQPTQRCRLIQTLQPRKSPCLRHPPPRPSGA